MEVGSCILALIANDLYSSFRVVIKWPKIQQRKLNCKTQQNWSFDGRQKQDTQQKNKIRKKELEHKKNEYCKNMQQMLMKTRRQSRHVCNRTESNKMEGKNCSQDDARKKRMPISLEMNTRVKQAKHHQTMRENHIKN